MAIKRSKSFRAGYITVLVGFALGIAKALDIVQTIDWLYDNRNPIGRLLNRMPEFIPTYGPLAVVILGILVVVFEEIRLRRKYRSEVAIASISIEAKQEMADPLRDFYAPSSIQGEKRRLIQSWHSIVVGDTVAKFKDRIVDYSDVGSFFQSRKDGPALLYYVDALPELPHAPEQREFSVA